VEREEAKKRTIHVGILAESSEEQAPPSLLMKRAGSTAERSPEPHAAANGATRPDPRESLRESLIRLRETVESEFPTVPAHQQLLRDELIAFLVEHMPTGRDEFASAVPVFIRQNIDVEQARRYLGTIFSLCEQYA
jgi:hypothetical protein